MAKQNAQCKADVDRAAQRPALEALIGYNLKRAYVLVNKDFREALGEGGLSSRVFAALSLTVSYPNITQSELARMIGIERSGLVAMVDELEAKGYLRRAPVPGDRRVQALVPTDAGRDAYAQTLALVQAHEDSLFADMTAAEKDTLLGLLRKIRAKEENS